MSQINVLVAEDNEAMRRRIVRILSWEFRVIGAVTNGDELMKAAVTLRPDVIVSDICIPQHSRIQALNELKGGGITVPFVLVSAEPVFRDGLSESCQAHVHENDLLLELNPAVRSAVAGEPFLSSGYRRKI